MTNIRTAEYKTLLYRLALAYFFYFIARLLFIAYNNDLLKVESIGELLRLCYYGLNFDTTAILYTNSLFILCSILPLFVNTHRNYQIFLFWIYILPNALATATNFIDFIYYKFIFTRSTIASFESIESEENKSILFFNFLLHYWHVFLLYFVCIALWVWLYKRVKVVEVHYPSRLKYFIFSIIGFVFTVVLCIGGIRGDFKKSTRPINMIDAHKYTTNIVHGSIILNTPFSIIRTLFKRGFDRQKLVAPSVIADKIKPIKTYNRDVVSKPNIVVFILESYGKEYIGAFNKDTNVKNYESFTPFLDSLAQHSLIFTNAHANGYKSIHGMSSILAGIPSFDVAFTSSAYSNQRIESIVSILKSEGYSTSFLHGAPNGSMGFLGFGNILGFDNYYGKTEFNNDNEFDGTWGIWDEPFFQFMKTTLDGKKQPFFATVFSVTSHEPFVVPEKYANKFPKGHVPMHQCVGYTDFALRKFFESAQKEPWFENTIFILTADHTNQVHFPEYAQPINHSAVPIMIYQPKNKELVGENKDFAQQIDIYPTITDLIGYKKPFRSWGRSLLSEKEVLPFVINYSGSIYQFMRGNYICTFDGKKATGFYAKNDLSLQHNLIGSRNTEMDEIETCAKAFIQDYFDRITLRKLFAE